MIVCHKGPIPKDHWEMERNRKRDGLGILVCRTEMIHGRVVEKVKSNQTGGKQ